MDDYTTAVEGEVLEDGTLFLSEFAALSTDDKLIEIYRQIIRFEDKAKDAFAQAENMVQKFSQNPMLAAFLG